MEVEDYTKPANPADHHALANMIGTQLLMHDNTTDPHINSLRNLMEVLGLVPRRTDQAAGALLQQGRHG